MTINLAYTVASVTFRNNGRNANVTETIIDPMIWARSVGLEEIALRFPADVEAAWRDARRDLDDLPPEPPPHSNTAADEKPKS